MKIHAAYSSPCRWQVGKFWSPQNKNMAPYSSTGEIQISRISKDIIDSLLTLKPKIFTVASKLKVYLADTLSEVEAQAQQHVYGVNIVKLG